MSENNHTAMIEPEKIVVSFAEHSGILWIFVSSPSRTDEKISIGFRHRQVQELLNQINCAMPILED